ncbi:hypothetical protein KQI65_04820 [bacterium]|nr:hypothetical protein [bacterium]
MRIAYVSLSLCTLFLILLFHAPATSAHTQRPDGGKRSFRASDHSSIDAIVRALYASVSGRAGEKDDWDRLRALFTQSARLQPVVWKGKDDVQLRTVSVDDYIRSATKYFESGSFHEREIGRRVERFGHIAHVFSTYESFEHAEDPLPFARGINSIQLYHDGSRWWILSVLWDEEREGSSIPDHYLEMP